MLPTTIDFRGFCSSQFPGGRGWEKRLGFKEQSAERTASEHWVLEKERGCLQTPSGRLQQLTTLAYWERAYSKRSSE